LLLLFFDTLGCIVPKG